MNEAAKSARERFITSVQKAGGAAQAALRLRCSRAYVDMIRTGRRRPGMLTASAIEREFGIRMQEWMEVEVPPRGGNEGEADPNNQGHPVGGAKS